MDNTIKIYNSTLKRSNRSASRLIVGSDSSVNVNTSISTSNTNITNTNTMNNTTNNTDNSINMQSNVNTYTPVDSSMMTSNVIIDNSSIMNINSSPYTYTLDEAAEFQAMIDNEYNNNNMN